MRRRHGRVNRWVLVVLALVSLGLFHVELRSARRHRTRFFGRKLEAARLSTTAFSIVRDYRERLGIPVDTINDPGRTGLVGVQYSQLTYGRNDLSDVLTTLNPNFSAALVEILVDAGVRSGDRVGISWDGTFPALNIQMLAAVRSLDLHPVIVTALSAGMWGANLPGFTWLDIERLLADSGVFEYRSVHATLGGEADDGRALSPAGREILQLAADANGVELHVPGSMTEAVERRLEALEGVKAVVSIGRVVADAGDPMARIPSRTIRKSTDRVAAGGMIARLLQRGVPVVFLGNPSRVALDHGLPIAPVPLPDAGTGRLFYQRRYSVLLAAVIVLVLLALLLLVVRYNIESYFGAARRPPDEEAV